MDEQRRIDKHREEICERLYDVCTHLTFDDKGHSDAWRNKLARDLNHLLGRAQFFLETSRDESDVSSACATLRVVRRVAEFEDIKRLKP
jgi:hypothetical protein